MGVIINTTRESIDRAIKRMSELGFGEDEVIVRTKPGSDVATVAAEMGLPVSHTDRDGKAWVREAVLRVRETG